MKTKIALEIVTPKGLLVAEIKGEKDEYPGIVISLKKDNDSELIPLTIVEYENIQDVLQTVVYANKLEDIPSNVIKHNLED